MEKKLREYAMNVLRRDSYKTQEKAKALKKSFSHAEGRYHVHHCQICKGLFKRKEMQVDHILTVIPLDYTDDTFDFNEVIPRLYCKESGLQHICKECHYDKTQFENHLRNMYKTGNIKKDLLDEKLLEYLEDIKK